MSETTDQDALESKPSGQVSFATTQWTRVLAVRGDSPESRAALSDLCHTYYQPVCHFIQRRLSRPEKAEDMTHDFFESILKKSSFDHLDPSKSKFRTYLLGAVKHFLSKQSRKESRLKRGSGLAHESLSQMEENPHASLASHNEAHDDRQFDCEWALQQMSRALEQLEHEFETSDRSLHFKTLKPWLVGQTEALSQRAAAETLKLSEGAIKVAIHRLRKRFRECIKAEIISTLGPNDTVEEELRYLVDVLSHQ